MKELMKKTAILFGIVLIFALVDILSPSLLVKLFAEVAYLVYSMILIYHSVSLIKRSQLLLGGAYIAVCSFLIIVLIIALVTGPILGLGQEFQAASITGHAVSLLG